LKITERSALACRVLPDIPPATKRQECEGGEDDDPDAAGREYVQSAGII